jgi:pimeloyl-ACP methyl ester carboxylesterase
MRRFLIFLLIIGGIGAAGWYSGSRAPIDEIAIAQDRTGLDLTPLEMHKGDLVLSAVFAGPVDGPPVILLHGFPEFWFSWHQVMKPLADAGYRVVAPDLRGYNRSSRPADAQSYTMQAFGDDIIALMDANGWDDAYVAGHDVGAGVTWRLVFDHPDRIRKAVMFSASHPMAWAAAQPEDDDESISWFRDFFKLPFLPELVARSGDWWLLSKNLTDTSAPGTFNAEDLDIYKSAWARDNAISTMIGSYRANQTLSPNMPSDGKPAVPVKFFYGDGDAFTPAASARKTGDYIGAENVNIWEGVSHWIPAEVPERAAAELIAFFVEAPAEASTEEAPTEVSAEETEIEEAATEE